MYSHLLRRQEHICNSIKSSASTVLYRPLQ